MVGKRIKSLRELRGYGLGERNPDTLPGHGQGVRETPAENDRQSRTWRSLRRKVQAGRFIGAKY